MWKVYPKKNEKKMCGLIFSSSGQVFCPHFFQFVGFLFIRLFVENPLFPLAVSHPCNPSLESLRQHKRPPAAWRAFWVLATKRSHSLPKLYSKCSAAGLSNQELCIFPPRNQAFAWLRGEKGEKLRKNVKNCESMAKKW